MPDNAANDTPLPEDPNRVDDDELFVEEPLELFDFFEDEQAVAPHEEPNALLDFYEQTHPQEAEAVSAESAEVVEEPLELLEFFEEEVSPPAEPAVAVSEVAPTKAIREADFNDFPDSMPESEIVAEEPNELLDFYEDEAPQPVEPVAVAVEEPVAEVADDVELLDFFEEEAPQPVAVAVEEPVAEVANDVELLDFFEEEETPQVAEPVASDEVQPAAAIDDEERFEMLEFIDPPSKERTEITESLPRTIEERTWAEIALDDEPMPSPPPYVAEKTQFLDLDEDIFNAEAERTELEMPASAVNLIHPDVEPTLTNDDEDSGEVSVDMAPPSAMDEPLTAAKLYHSADSQERPMPTFEPIEFGAGAEEIDFDILRTDESSSRLYGSSSTAAEASGVQLGETPSAVDSASSIFGDDPGIVPTSPGSGWYDSPRSAKYAMPPIPLEPPPPSSTTTVGQPEPPRSNSSVADLFGMLARGPATPNVSVSSGWVKDDKTGTISESEVLKAFDLLAKPASTGRIPPSPASDALSEPVSQEATEAGPDFNFVDLEGEGSHLFPQTEHDIEIVDEGTSGVDILEPHPGVSNDTGGSQSSIFSHQPRVEDDLTEQISFDDEIDVGESQLLKGSGIAGSSIFEKGSPKSPWEAEDDLDATSPEAPSLDDAELSERTLKSHAAIEAGLGGTEEGSGVAIDEPVEEEIDWNLGDSGVAINAPAEAEIDWNLVDSGVAISEPAEPEIDWNMVDSDVALNAPEAVEEEIEWNEVDSGVAIDEPVEAGLDWNKEESGVALHAPVEAGDWESGVAIDSPAEAPVEAGLDWNDLGAADDQVSMYMPRPEDSLAEIDDLFHPTGPVSPSLRPEKEIQASDSASNFVNVEGSISAADSGIIHGDSASGLLLGPPSSAIRNDPSAYDIEEPVALAEPQRPKDKKPKKKDDAPAKRKGSLGGWIGGGIAGVLIGAGAFGGAYMAGLLPNGESSNTSVSPPLAKADPKIADDLKAALAKLDETEKKAKEEAEVASNKLRENGEMFNKLKDDFDDAKAAAMKAQTELKTAMTAAEKAKEDLKLAMVDADKAKDDVKLAKADTEKAVKDLTDTKKMLTEAETLAADTEKKRKDADDALAGIVKELKTAKLVPDTDEPAAALAKVPTVLKEAAIAMTSADAKKAAEALLQAKKDLDAAKLAMAKAEESLTLAKTEAKDAMTAAEKAKTDAAKLVAEAKKETDDKVAAAIEKTAMESKKKLDDAAAAVLAADAKLKTDALAHETQLKALNETHGKQLLEARAGGGIELTTAEARALDKSFAAYGKGVNAYHAKSYADAEKALLVATAEFASDARYWYFLGLAQFQQGKTADAEASFKKGADLEKRNLPGRTVINEDLQRIQGTLRQELAKFRP